MSTYYGYCQVFTIIHSIPFHILFHIHSFIHSSFTVAFIHKLQFTSRMDNVHLFLDAGFYLYEFHHFVARYDEIDTLKQLLAAGLDINSKDEYGNTALHNAAANGNL